MSDKDGKRMDQTEESMPSNGHRMTASAVYDLLDYDAGESLASRWIPVAVQYVLAGLRPTN